MTPQLQDTLGMFAFLAGELSVLFIGISLLVGMLQRHIPPSRVEKLLSSNRSRGYFLAAGLGAMTPFCSCSTIPMLKGLIRARAGFGPMMVFLFTSPLLNPIIVVLMGATFGLRLTAVYVVAALGVSLCSGWLLHVLGFERYVRQESRGPTTCCDSDSAEPVSDNCCSEQPSCAAPIKIGRYKGLWREAWSDFLGVLPYLLTGVAIGSAIYGFMPTELLEHYAGPDNPFAIPVAAIIGIPLYIRAEATIPLAAALLGKGVGAGAVLALIIGSAGASLTELILLRSLFTLRLLAAFVIVIIAMAMIAGYATHLFF
ncbi:permease [Cephaloticoccus primus]|uniref:Permease n=1 Tax=Cephaloticoccus primus TaxID=1548207 RepID=A0A139STT6_9BACT|nr:permease [Cephaloticoccus primus]KXU37892.1 permease [Cephaloticoccus primus]